MKFKHAKCMTSFQLKWQRTAIPPAAAQGAGADAGAGHVWPGWRKGWDRLFWCKATDRWLKAIKKLQG